MGPARRRPSIAKGAAASGRVAPATAKDHPLLASTVVILLSLVLSACTPTNANYRVDRLDPVSYSLSGDPKVIFVQVRWDQDGYCSGQFRPVVEEELDHVTVTTVENWVYLGDDGGCAGVGSEGFASGAAELEQPLGSRGVYGGSDQSPLKRLH